MTENQNSIARVVTQDLCIGCGLCESVTAGRVRMTMTSAGSLRPDDPEGFTQREEALLLAACPGISVSARQSTTAHSDEIWGGFEAMHYAWAGDSTVRFQAATGGVLTALGVHLLNTNQVEFLLHVRPDPQAPLRSIATISQSTDEVLSGMGSRYGPVAPLTLFMQALDRAQPFAVVAKPCDLSTIHNLAAIDPRVDRLCRFRLTMVCGGQSRLSKTWDLLRSLKVVEGDVSSIRYRGFGNPGLTTIDMKNGEHHERTYQQLWESEASWDLETRCKVCPDALGETADVAAADVWPEGGPTGEDEGFNGIVVRTSAGQALIDSAVAVGDLVRGEEISPKQFSEFQPHQVWKKTALQARFQGMRDAGVEPIVTKHLRLKQLARHLSQEQNVRERAGSKQRF